MFLPLPNQPALKNIGPVFDFCFQWVQGTG